MNDSLNLLRMGLGSFSAGLRRPEALSEISGIVRAKQQVLREHCSAGIVADTYSIASAVESFRRTGAVDGFKSLKYVCLGMGTVDATGWCALADPDLQEGVFNLIKAQPETRRRFRCLQALLSSFWSFPLNGKGVSDESKLGWRKLGSWLRAEHKRLLKAEEASPPWFASLTRHIALLGPKPCEHFGAALLRGDASELREAMESLTIPPDSWVLEEAVIAHMRAGCALDDEPFKATLTDLINTVSGRGGIEVGESLKLRSVALLISRYVKCAERPEHMALRDAAVEIIGNPWLRRAKWDAWVVDARGNPDHKARELVNGWLKRRLIADFFELLSVDGSGDSRRVDYWLRFEPVIEDMWFALGTDAQHRGGEQFSDFRRRAKGRLLDLDGTTPDNNAFVMRVGCYLFVEFGAKGHAMYLFEWDAIKAPLLDTLSSGGDRASVSIHRLKDTTNAERLIHRDSAMYNWEEKFDDDLTSRIGWRPSDTPRLVNTGRRKRNEGFSDAAWQLFTQTNGLQFKDNRAAQGALWVLGVEQTKHVATQLEAWGFKQRAPIGWFKE